jgi:poly(A) polymerase
MKTLAVTWYNRIPSHIKEILKVLKNRGHTAYLAGGCVRDFLLELPPKDFDIATSATPEEVAQEFPKTLDIGKAFGISMIVTPEETVEVARFRADGEYANHRHPTSVKFSSPEEDAKRRDFTINGLFYDPEQELVIDYVGGIDDLAARKIRAVGDPEKRIQEDALRMLRAVRFLAQLKKKGFSLDPVLITAVQKNAELIQKISKERVTQEILHILASAHPMEGLDSMVVSKLWSQMFRFPLPKIELEKTLTLWKNFFAESPQTLFLAVLFRAGKEELFQRLLLSADCKKSLHWILQQADPLAAATLAQKKTVAQSLHWREALVFHGMDCAPHELAPWIQWRNELGTRLDPPPLLSGEDLQRLGFTPGPKLGNSLKQLREAQLNEVVTTKEEAINFIKALA